MGGFCALLSITHHEPWHVGYHSMKNVRPETIIRDFRGERLCGAHIGRCGLHPRRWICRPSRQRSERTGGSGPSKRTRQSVSKCDISMNRGLSYTIDRRVTITGSSSALVFLRSVGNWQRRFCHSAIIATCLCLVSPDAKANGASAFLFGGAGVLNGWQDVFTETTSLEYTVDGLIGIAVAREWQARFRGLSFGIEAQLSYHTGSQTYVEIAAPAVLRYAPDWRVPIDSFAYGLGFSWTSDISELEVEKGGSSQRTLFYWMIEAEFPFPSDGWTGVTRLHHRSNGFDTFEEPGSSNFVVLGIRRRF